MKHHALIAAILISGTVACLAEPPYPADEAQQKRIVMQMRGDDGTVGVEVALAKKEDEDRSPIELLEKQVGLKWSGFEGGVVYRFDRRSNAWEPIMSRDMRSTETVVGKASGLKIRELKTGDVLILHGGSF